VLVLTAKLNVPVSLASKVGHNRHQSGHKLLLLQKVAEEAQVWACL
jgi:hypothetical protein